MYEQLPLFDFEVNNRQRIQPFKTQLLKWIGNKQRFAHEIIEYFPDNFGTYFEPFLGSGAVLGCLAPNCAKASDILKPLIEIWQTLSTNPTLLKKWYSERWHEFKSVDKVEGYEKIKAAYNAGPNGAESTISVTLMLRRCSEV